MNSPAFDEEALIADLPKVLGRDELWLMLWLSKKLKELMSFVVVALAGRLLSGKRWATCA